MEKILSEILVAEKKSEQIIEEARKQASELAQKADADSAEKIAGARKEAQTILHEAAETARAEAQKKREEKVHAALLKSNALMDTHAPAVQNLVGRICGMITTTGFEKSDR